MIPKYLKIIFCFERLYQIPLTERSMPLSVKGIWYTVTILRAELVNALLYKYTHFDYAMSGSIHIFQYYNIVRPG